MASPYRDAATVPRDLPRVAARWVPREAPLAVRAVAVGGAVARALREALLRHDDATLARWRAVAAGEDLVVVGEELPWVDGALWLGRDPAAPAWLLPTAQRPDVPAALLLRAIPGAHPAVPHAAWPTARGLRVVPLVEARPIARARLARWEPAP